ncbi:hypothetical protein D3C85_751110 [compost metagenome]
MGAVRRGQHNAGHHQPGKQQLGHFIGPLKAATRRVAQGGVDHQDEEDDDRAEPQHQTAQADDGPFDEDHYKLLRLRGPSSQKVPRGGWGEEWRGRVNNQRVAAITFFRYGPMGVASHFSSTAAVAEANSALFTVVTCTPFAFSSSSNLASASAESLR